MNDPASTISADVSEVEIVWPLEMPSYARAKAMMLRAYLVAALERTGGNVTRAARIACVQRSNFLRLLRTYGLREGT